MERTLESAKILCHVQPSGLFNSDGKSPDRASIVPLEGRKVLIWDATHLDTFVSSHLRLVVRELRAVVDDAEFRKAQTYSNFESSRYFVLLTVNLLGVFEKEAWSFFEEVRAASEIVIRQSYGTPISGAVNLGGCAKRKLLLQC